MQSFWQSGRKWQLIGSLSKRWLWPSAFGTILVKLATAWNVDLAVAYDDAGTRATKPKLDE